MDYIKISLIGLIAVCHPLEKSGFDLVPVEKK